MIVCILQTHLKEVHVDSSVMMVAMRERHESMYYCIKVYLIIKDSSQNDVGR